MKNVIGFILIFMLPVSSLFAQKVTGSASQLLYAPFVTSTNEHSFDGPQWDIVLENKSAEIELYPTGADIDKQKAILAAARNKVLTPKLEPKKIRTLPPVMGKNFKANQLHSLVPADNSIAISKNGKIVSTDNWNLTYADTNGTILQDSIVWRSFLNNDARFLGYTFDPRVIYDPYADRFIVILMHGAANPAQSSMAIAFSKTNDPMLGWNIFELDGNPFNDGSWADYPSVGINENELFINVNLFGAAPTYNYKQSIIYQIDLTNGYTNGATSLVHKIWGNNIATTDGKPGFTIVPAQEGMGEAGGNTMWFVSAWPEGDTVINSFKITGNLYASNAQLITTPHKIPAFSVCANALIYDPPTGTFDSISTGSSIVQNAYRVGEIIHFTLDANVGTGWCGIQYGRINTTTNTVKIKTFGQVGTVLCYPAVAHFGRTANDKSAMICYLQTDTSLYPRICAIAVDDNMNFSNPIVLKSGDTTINMLVPNNQPERWGDYTGIQKKYDANPPEVWCAGSYAGNNSRLASYNTWIAQVKSAEFPLQLTTPELTNKAPIVYPNPIYDEFKIDVDNTEIQQTKIYIINQLGQEIKVFYDGMLNKGGLTLHFNKGVLPTGNYTIVIEQKNNRTTHVCIVQ